MIDDRVSEARVEALSSLLCFTGLGMFAALVAQSVSYQPIQLGVYFAFGMQAMDLLDCTRAWLRCHRAAKTR